MRRNDMIGRNGSASANRRSGSRRARRRNGPAAMCSDFSVPQVEHLASKDLSLVLRGCAQDSPLVVIDGEVCDITGGPYAP